MKKRIRIQGISIFLAMMILIFYHPYLFPAGRPKSWDAFLAGSGICLVLIGYVLRISARGTKAELNPDGKTLVRQGPYALTRNPMYLGTLLIGLGVVLALFRWWVFFIFLGIYLAIYLPQINREEKILGERFGEEFRQYCRNTPQFFPGAKKIFSTPLRQHLKIKLAWAQKELSSLCITLALIIGIKIAEYLNLTCGR